MITAVLIVVTAAFLFAVFGLFCCAFRNGGRERKAAGAQMNDRFQQALQSSQIETIAAAETKLGRALSADDRAGIERVASLMMLEALYRSFTFPDYTPAEVESDLRHFANQTE